jgi:hypothetical protein
MASEDTTDGSKPFHYEDGVPVFDVRRVDKLERQQGEAEARDSKYKDEQLQVNKWMMRFTGALVLFAAVTGIINGVQAHIASLNAKAAQDNAAAAKAQADATKAEVDEMKKSGTDTHDLAVQAKQQADSSKQQAANTGILAENASETLANTQAAFRDDQRAWIGIDEFRVVEFSENKPIKIDIELTNTGKTPALHVYEWMKHDFSGISQLGPPLHLLPTTLWLPVGSVPPQGHQALHVEIPWERWKANDLQIRLKTKYLSAFGEISYEDTSKRHHTTQLCLYMRDPDTQTLFFCDRWNDMN